MRLSQNTEVKEQSTMASSAPFLFLFLGLFTIVGSEDCSMYGGKYEWCYSGKFCCGTCGETYCCSDLGKRVQARLDCLLKKGFKNLGPPPRMDSVPDGVLVPIVVVPILVTFIIGLITCWVCPCCCLHKRFRSPRPVISTTSLMTTQYLPQPVVQGGRYLPCQPWPSIPPYGGQPMPNGSFRGQPYQEAGPFTQAPNDGGQAMYPIQPAQPTLPTDYTSPQPAYNPAYVELPHTTLATPAQSFKTSF